MGQVREGAYHCVPGKALVRIVEVWPWDRPAQECPESVDLTSYVTIIETLQVAAVDMCQIH